MYVPRRWKTHNFLVGVRQAHAFFSFTYILRMYYVSAEETLVLQRTYIVPSPPLPYVQVAQSERRLACACVGVH
jgi:hypothetical protein